MAAQSAQSAQSAHAPLSDANVQLFHTVEVRCSSHRPPTRNPTLLAGAGQVKELCRNFINDAGTAHRRRGLSRLRRRSGRISLPAGGDGYGRCLGVTTSRRAAFLLTADGYTCKHGGMSIVLDGRYATVSEAAAELGVSRQRVHGLIKSGQLAAEVVHERLTIIPRDSLDAIKKASRPHGVHIDKRPDPKPPAKRKRRAG